MEQGMGSGSIDKSRVLDVRPLRCLVPVFPNSPSTPQPPSGPYPPGVQPFYPFLVPNGTQQAPSPGAHQNQPSNFSFDSSIPAPVPLNSFRATPTPHETWGTTRSQKAFKSPPSYSVPLEDDEYNTSQNQSDNYVDGTGSSRKPPSARQLRKTRAATSSSNGVGFNVDSLVENFMTSFKLGELDEFRKSNGNKDTVGTILLVFDLLRRKLTQLENSTRPDLKACNLLMTKGIRTNSCKRIGNMPGIEVGDVFFFRMEMCLVGAHAPSMAGIDYMTVKSSTNEEPIAISIVSSGGYDDDDVGDGDVLIYSGQGGVQRDGQMIDQKLERGNLALEKSLHRGNGVRVVRGVKDSFASSTGKIYVYDGLYKIQESWAEKKSGCNVFKYKLVRLNGQPEAFSLWKSIQRWKEGTAARPGLILPDLASGAEGGGPVTLVNDVDSEKGPAHFTYVSTLKYLKPFLADKTFLGCQCVKGCDTKCACSERNDRCLPYSSLGVLLTDKSLIYECGPTCTCPPTCRSRLTEAGLKVRLEVFKTNNRGWGVRSWDPIRAGGFICEYAGEAFTSNEFFRSGNDDNNYVFDATRYFEPLRGETRKPSPFPLVINAEKKGNVARFMNHCCSPNVFWKPVLRESNNESYLHIALFAIQHIPPMQELTFDYGVVPPERRDKGKKRCFCGSMKCREYFY